MLITQELTVTETGQRRTPVMISAILGVGALALLVLATTIDTWQRAKEEQRAVVLGDVAKDDRTREGLHLAPADRERSIQSPEPTAPRTGEAGGTHGRRSPRP